MCEINKPLPPGGGRLDRGFTVRHLVIALAHNTKKLHPFVDLKFEIADFFISVLQTCYCAAFITVILFVFQISDSNPPILSDTHQSPESLSHPIPRRPPKGERRTQAKEYFRSHTSQRVRSPSSDSDGGEMEDRDFPPHSPRYGNIEAIRMNAQLEGATCRNHSSQEEIHPSTHESDESSCVSASPVERKSLDDGRVVKSQRDALRLKINLKKEPSVDEDVPPGSKDPEGVTEQRKPKRPATPLSIKRNVFTTASVSIN